VNYDNEKINNKLCVMSVAC